MLKIENVNTGYGKKQVLFNISFNITKGDFLLLKGGNGSGKSTLLKVIFGLIPIWNSNGIIHYEDVDLNSLSISDRLKKGIVYIPQKNELFNELTIQENLELSVNSIYNKEEVNNKIATILEQIPLLKKKLNKEARILSGGERKLLSLSMALMNNPKLLLIDEPLAGVSFDNIKLITNTLQKFKNNGVTMIVIEHQTKKITNFASKIMYLKNGTIVVNDNI